MTPTSWAGSSARPSRWRKLSHPNIVGVYDQGADGQYLYLAMEYVPGRTLRALLRERGWLPWQEALSVMDPVLAGLAAAHQAGIVHRDVKPENVLITADGRVKVVDFGLARAQAAVGNTRAGMIIGSVAYIAPEQVTGAPSDARTDVYAAGIVLFEMLTGRQPFTGESPLAVAYAHVNSRRARGEHARRRDPAGRRPAGAGGDEQGPAAAAAGRGRVPAGGAGAARHRRPAESVAGAWAGAGAGRRPTPYGRAPAPTPGPARRAARRRRGGGSHTMVVGARLRRVRAATGVRAVAAAGRYDAGAARRRRGAPVPRRRGTAAPAASEPFLQRWLFSRRFVYVAAAAHRAWSCSCGGGWWLTSGRYTPVPAVAKMTATAATQALQQAGFQVQTGPSVIDDNVPKGEVISTSPSGRALPGATIVLTVSQGPRMISVPPIPTGDTVAQAMALLRAAGLTVTATTKPVGVASNPVIGAVAGTTPPAGTSRPENKPVHGGGGRRARAAQPGRPGHQQRSSSGRAPNHVTISRRSVDRAASRRAPSCRSRPRRARRCSRGRPVSVIGVERAARGAHPRRAGPALRPGAAGAASSSGSPASSAAGLLPANKAHEHEPVRPGADGHADHREYGWVLARVPLIGSHATITGGLATGGLAYAAAVGAEVIQVFVSNPRGWAAGPGDAGAGRAASRVRRSGLRARHVHDQPRVRQPGGGREVGRRGRARAAPRRGDRRARRGGAHRLRGRLDRHGGTAREQALRQIGELALPLLDKLGDDDPDLLFEPMAGQGQMLCARAGDLAAYLAAVEYHPKAGVCLDTCHLFAAGHDLTAPGGVAADARRGRTPPPGRPAGCRLVHANDSLLGCGSKRDRHETIGAGQIGTEPFRELLAALPEVPVRGGDTRR